MSLLGMVAAWSSRQVELILPGDCCLNLSGFKSCVPESLFREAEKIVGCWPAKGPTRHHIQTSWSSLSALVDQYVAELIAPCSSVDSCKM